MKKKKVHFALAAIFALFAIVQYNDPDPFLWMLVYGSVTFIAILMVYLPQVRFGPLIITLIVILSLFSLTYIPSFIDFLSRPNKVDLIGKMKAGKPWIEDAREFLGLLLVVGSLLYLRTNSRK